MQIILFNIGWKKKSKVRKEKGGACGNLIKLNKISLDKNKKNEINLHESMLMKTFGLSATSSSAEHCLASPLPGPILRLLWLTF